MFKRLLLSVAALGWIGIGAAQAETYPSHQVTVIVPFAAGGPNWRNSFDPAAVPKGYAEAWERLRPAFEGRFDLSP